MNENDNGGFGAGLWFLVKATCGLALIVYVFYKLEMVKIGLGRIMFGVVLALLSLFLLPDLFHEDIGAGLIISCGVLWGVIASIYSGAKDAEAYTSWDHKFQVESKSGRASIVQPTVKTEPDWDLDTAAKESPFDVALSKGLRMRMTSPPIDPSKN